MYIYSSYFVIYYVYYPICIYANALRLCTLDGGCEKSWTVVAVRNAKCTNVCTRREAGITGKSSR